jgi:hypothetical protein
VRDLVLCCAVLVTAQSVHLHAQRESPAPLSLLDVPFISQTELLCGGAAAAMVLRYWGERGIAAESFSNLVDRSAAGIRTDVLIADLKRRGWVATGLEGTDETIRNELARGRPVLTLIEDRPATFHYIVVLAAHERGVVFHDPARAPFLVMSAAEFDRRWRAADRWMGMVLPPGSPAATPLPKASSADPGELAPSSVGTPCDRTVAEGVRMAQAGELEAAERLLAAAIGCPAALRELAGVRVLQKRWDEASDLASAATAADEQDVYAWKLLATSRFVQSDRMGALAAWNRVEEPRLDLVRIDGLTRTRHRVVERLVSVDAGEVLTEARFARASRRLSELPAARTTRLEYVPVGSGLAELRGAVDERPLVATGRLSLAAMGITALATREVRLTTGSVVGGGEQLFAAWRFWPRRPSLAGGISAPAPWGGVWNVMAYTGRQAFTSDFPTADRAGARVGTADWLTSNLRWNVTVGADRWKGGPVRSTLGGGLGLTSSGDRVEGRISANTWFGDAGFSTAETSLRVRSSTERRGTVVTASTTVQSASRQAPLDLWWAGDTGAVRPALLRAHPALTRGRLRTDRLGRAVIQGSFELQRWWRVVGPVSAAAAAFVDVAHTALRADQDARDDVDLGIGARVSVPGMPGVLRVDLGKGLRDGRTAVSFVYEP